MERLKLSYVKTLGKGEHDFDYAPLSGVKFNFYKRKIKMMNNENGRSMVEMLGVLAIIGVLSVAGIAGYSMAMKKYRVNEILNAASQCAVLAQAKYETTNNTATVSASSFGYTGEPGGVKAVYGNDGGTITLGTGDKYKKEIHAATKCKIGVFAITSAECAAN